MSLPERAYVEYQECYKKAYGKEISLEEARIQADRLINGLHAVYKIKRSLYDHKKHDSQQQKCCP